MIFSNRIGSKVLESPKTRLYEDFILIRIAPNTFSSRILVEILDPSNMVFNCFFGNNQEGWASGRTFGNGFGSLGTGDVLKIFGFSEDWDRVHSVRLGSLAVINLEYLLNCQNLSSLESWIDIDEYNSSSFSFANFSQPRELELNVVEYQAYVENRYFQSSPVKDFNLADIGQLQQLERLRLTLNLGIRFIDLSPLGNLVNLIYLEIFDDQGVVSINPLSSLSNLEEFRVNLREANGRVDFSQMTNLSYVGIAGMERATVADIDFMMQTLYQGSVNNSATGKTLFIRNLRVDPSGNRGDFLSSGTGQGYITGLIDDYGWVVIQ